MASNLLSFLSAAQQQSIVCAVIDCAHTFDLGEATAAGVDCSALLVSQPDNEFQALEIAHTLAASGSVGLVVVSRLAPKTDLADYEPLLSAARKAEILLMFA